MASMGGAASRSAIPPAARTCYVQPCVLENPVRSTPDSSYPLTLPAPQSQSIACCSSNPRVRKSNAPMSFHPLGPATRYWPTPARSASTPVDRPAARSAASGTDALFRHCETEPRLLRPRLRQDHERGRPAPRRCRRRAATRYGVRSRPSQQWGLRRSSHRGLITAHDPRGHRNHYALSPIRRPGCDVGSQRGRCRPGCVANCHPRPLLRHR